MTSLQEAESAKAKLRNILDGVLGINGIGIAWDADGSPCVRVNIQEDIAENSRQKIPTRIGNVGVQVETIGEIRLQAHRGSR